MPPNKRPSPPAPDPNWEMELHAPPGTALLKPPESRDPLLAHALLHSEPDPLFDEFGELDRATLPPPEGMSDHVARMMAEASLNEALAHAADRATMEVLEPGSEPSTPAARNKSGRSSGTNPAVRLPREDPEPEMDLSDLPAVFTLDGLDDDEPGERTLPRNAQAPSFVEPPTFSDTPASSDPPGFPPSSGPAISPPFGSLDLESMLPGEPSADKIAAIEGRIAAGDYGRALGLAEAALEEHPGAESVTKLAEDCREMLYNRYLDRLGATGHVPRLAVQHNALTGLALDHRAGFLLSCVDGGSTVEEIIDVSAMPRLDAVRLLYELLQEGIIEMASSR